MDTRDQPDEDETSGSDPGEYVILPKDDPQAAFQAIMDLVKGQASRSDDAPRPEQHD